MKKTKDFTRGPIIKSLLSLSLPIIFTNILQTAYQLTDTFWVGRLGSVAVAAVSVTFPVIFLIISLGSGMAIAGSILIAQYFGKKDKHAIDHIASQTLLMVFIISIFLSGIGYFFSPVFIKLMGVEPRVFEEAVSYMRISFAGLTFVYLFMVFQSLMRGTGDVKTPMYIVLGTVLLNLILDPLFIFGYGMIPGFGVSGAAIATIFTQGLAAFTGIYLLTRGKFHIHLKLHNLKPDWPLVRKMFKLGFPASVEQSTRALGMTVMVLLVSGFGTLALAAYGIGGRILSFVIIPAIGLSMATATLVGQNMGAGKIKRAEKIAHLSMLTGFLGLGVTGILFYVFSHEIAAVFIPGETETIDLAARFIRFLSVSFGFIGLQMALNGVFRGSGNTMISMMLSIISLWILRFPLAYFLGYKTPMGITGIWIAFPVSNFLAALVALFWFLRGTWKNKKVTEEIRLITETEKETIVEEGAGNDKV